MSDYRELIAEEQGVELWDDYEIYGDECEYCKVEGKFSGYGLSLISEPYLSVSICKVDFSEKYFLVTNEYAELKNIKGQYSNSPFRSDKKQIYVCPMCGRKLGE